MPNEITYGFILGIVIWLPTLVINMILAKILFIFKSINNVHYWALFISSFFPLLSLILMFSLDSLFDNGYIYDRSKFEVMSYTMLVTNIILWIPTYFVVKRILLPKNRF